MPSPMPEYLNVHYICESASRLLFLSMHWARSISAFSALGYEHLWRAEVFLLQSKTSASCLICVSASPSQEANTSLVRACWNELFTLGLAQCAHVMNLSTILSAIINHLQSSIQDGTDQRLRHHFTVGSTRMNRSEQMWFIYYLKLFLDCCHCWSMCTSGWTTLLSFNWLVRYECFNICYWFTQMDNSLFKGDSMFMSVSYLI